MQTQANHAQPFDVELDPTNGRVAPEATSSIMHLSGMQELFADPAAATRLAVENDRVVYRTSAASVPKLDGHVGIALTVIEPGEVAGEFHMTQGHAHVRDEGEAYTCLDGEGGILLRRVDEVVWVPLKPERVGYIPPGWAHRSVNTGNVPFVFIAHYPQLSGQNYEPVRRAGMGARVFRTALGYQVVADDGRQIHSNR